MSWKDWSIIKSFMKEGICAEYIFSNTFQRDIMKSSK